MIKIHILLVDDETDVLFLFKQQFKKWVRAGDLSLSFSASGDEALELLESESGHDVILILSDINMPGLDGFELLEEVKRRYPKIETILVSGYSSKDYERKASSMGALSYMEKPVDFSVLKGMLSEKYPSLS